MWSWNAEVGANDKITAKMAIPMAENVKNVKAKEQMIIPQQKMAIPMAENVKIVRLSFEALHINS